MMALSVSSNFNCFWRGSIFKIFFGGEGLKERTKTRLYLRALFVHSDAAELLTAFVIIFLLLLSAQGQCVLEKVS